MLTLVDQVSQIEFLKKYIDNSHKGFRSIHDLCNEQVGLFSISAI